MNSRIMAFGAEIWHKSAVPVFLEGFVLPLFAGAVILFGITNPMGFDGVQRITGSLALIFGAYFVAHTVYKGIRVPATPPISVPSTQPIEPQVEPQDKPTIKGA